MEIHFYFLQNFPKKFSWNQGNIWKNFPDFKFFPESFFFLILKFCLCSEPLFFTWTSSLVGSFQGRLEKASKLVFLEIKSLKLWHRFFVLNFDPSVCSCSSIASVPTPWATALAAIIWRPSSSSWSLTSRPGSLSTTTRRRLTAAASASDRPTMTTPTARRSHRRSPSSTKWPPNQFKKVLRWKLFWLECCVWVAHACFSFQLGPCWQSLPVQDCVIPQMSCSNECPQHSQISSAFVSSKLFINSHSSSLQDVHQQSLTNWFRRK